MSFDGGGGGPRGSGASGGEGNAPRGSGASGGGEQRASEGRASQGSAGAGEKKTSVGSAAGRVSFVGEAAEGRKSGGSGGYYGETRGEDGNEEHADDCNCSDCECPPDDEPAPEKAATSAPEEPSEAYQLDEFMRAKAYFQQKSAKSGINLYDHLSDVIRKFLDLRAPNNPVDYLEEVSMNVKRYSHMTKKQDQDTLHDDFDVGRDALDDSQRLLNYWKTFANWGDERKEMAGEGAMMPGGSFQNLLRLQYYLEQVNVGLAKEEMFRIALGIKELCGSRPQIGKVRFWGKIFGMLKNYYVVEAEFKFGGTDQATDMWSPKDEDNYGGARGNDGGGKGLEMNADQTFGRAKDVVLNHEFLQAYSKTSGLSPDKQAALLPKQGGGGGGRAAEYDGEGAPPGRSDMIDFDDPDSRADAMKWESYQQDLMQNFPQTKGGDPSQVPPEADGSGVNRRVFYVCNDLGSDWAMLPPVTPQQINGSRKIRWFLSGDLDSSVKSIPPFPGKEGHYLKSLLVRITAGSMASPKGYYKPKPGDGEMPGEEDDEEFESEMEEQPRTGNDAVQPVKKYQAVMKVLADPALSSWVHHTASILPQGRTIWWNPSGSKPKTRIGASDDVSEMDEDEDMEDEDEDEEIETPGKESGPPLFQAIAEDKAGDGRNAWSLLCSSSVFPEHQVVSVRSNVWTGSIAICTSKGKVSNVYIGDGLKFFPISYCPPISDAPVREYKAGPELEETQDPSVEQEQSWLDKLALKEISDMEAKFVDNEDGAMTGDDDEETDYEY